MAQLSYHPRAQISGGALAAGYFEQLFTSEVQAPNQEVLDKVAPCVSEAMNEALLKSYSREEVKKTLFNIGDLKAPGPDGLHAFFLQEILAYHRGRFDG